MCHQLEEVAVLSLLPNEATFHQGTSSRKAKVCFNRFSSMTVKAMLGQNLSHMVFENRQTFLSFLDMIRRHCLRLIR